MGVICMTMAKAMGCNEILTGGAILSGVFFGDRCSPVSTSALLVSELTHTNIFDNIRLMVRTAIVPLILTCAFYGVCGTAFPAAEAGNLSLTESFSGVFHLGLIPILPAAVIMVLSLFRVQVRMAMLASIMTALGVCLFWQHHGPVPDRWNSGQRLSISGSINLVHDRRRRNHVHGAGGTDHHDFVLLFGYL